MQLLSQETLVLSLDELGLEKDLAEVVNVAINAHTSGKKN
ncbi:MAG: hypothetical protein N4J56_006505 [Chroococcidiopsis sp. SAG 2025]|nr:hypothetical protein [Chroococcidiopsis sp. SAG 2025]